MRKSGSTTDPLLISVIVPVHNAEKYLARCLTSLRNQTYSHLEIILIDDGSTDRSGELCDAAARDDSRIKVIHEPALGPSAARNAGLAGMSGDLVTFVDADDDVSLDYLASLRALLDDPQHDIAVCSFLEVFPNGTERPFTSPRTVPEILDPPVALMRMLTENGFMLSVWGKLYPATFRPTLEFPVGKIFEDVGTTYRAFLAAHKISFLAQPKYHYHQNPGSIIHQSFTFASLDLIALTDKMCADIAAHFDLADSATTSADLITLQSALKVRRMHARFSVLRQMVMFDEHNLPSADKAHFLSERQQIVDFLLQHKNDILLNPVASRRDRLAMRSLMLGLPIFKVSWKFYQWLRRSGR